MRVEQQLPPLDEEDELGVLPNITAEDAEDEDNAAAEILEKEEDLSAEPRLELSVMDVSTAQVRGPCKFHCVNMPWPCST